MFGGVVNRSVIVNELWKYSIANKSWTKLGSDRFDTSITKLTFPHQTAGHTAHVIGNSMLVFFGYNQILGYLCAVQEYNFSMLIFCCM